MVKRQQHPLRIGIIKGQAKRINERIIDDQWTKYLSEHAELVGISPLAFFKLFDGSIHRWKQRLPDSLTTLAERLAHLCEQYGVQTLYVNIPMLTPYLLMARNIGKIDLGFLMIAHCVGSEYWLKLWLSTAPFLTGRDVLLSSSTASTQALCNISSVYEQVVSLPLCIDNSEQERKQRGDQEMAELLSIGRIEDVKNIHVLIDCFAAIRRKLPHAHLTIAGEYTGHDEQQINAYQAELQRLVHVHQLENAVTWAGAVEGEAKAALFERATLLLNLSTDPGETFGFNLLEAKTYGLPVVCTNWDGFRDVVSHGVDGWLVDCDWNGARPLLNSEQVVQYSLRILQGTQERKAMQDRALERAALFDHEQIMPQIVQEVKKRMCEPFVWGASDRSERFGERAMQAVLTPMRVQREIYDGEHLKDLDALELSPLDVFHSPATCTLEAWYPVCKPILQHYVGRCGDV